MRSEHIVLKQETVFSKRRKESKTESIRSRKKERKIRQTIQFCEDVKVHVTCVNMFNGPRARLPAGG